MEVSMFINSVVFDLDGTLAEFNLEVKTVRAEVRQFLIKRGLPPSILPPNESIFRMLEKTRVFMKNSDKTEEEYKIVREDVLSITRKYELKAARTTSILPGVLETIKELKGRDLKLAVFTINGKDSANYILKRLNLMRFFNTVISREEVSTVKPDPMHLEVTLKALGVNSRQAVVVGDSVVDMKSAKTLNVKAVGIASNDKLARELRLAGATHVIRSITELVSLIPKL